MAALQGLAGQVNRSTSVDSRHSRLRTFCRISASVASAASLGEVKKYCWLRSSTARTGATARGAHAVARCRFRFLTDLATHREIVSQRGVTV